MQSPSASRFWSVLILLLLAPTALAVVPPQSPPSPVPPPAPQAPLPPPPPPAPVATETARGQGPQTPIAITRALSMNGSVRIDNGAGSIHVVAWDKPEVQVIGTQPAAAKPPVVESSADRFSLRIRAKVERCWMFFSCSQTLLPAQLTVYVPRQATLALESISAMQSVQGMRSARVSLDSVSGTLELRADSIAVARLHAISGSIRVQQSGIGRLEADNVSGGLHAAASACRQAHVTTISGDIELGCGNVSEAKLSSVSGDAHFAMTALAAGGSVRVNTVSGDARLTVPAGMSARLQLDSTSGSIGGALPAGVTVREHSVSGQWGSGAGSVHVETVSGDIRIVGG